MSPPEAKPIESFPTTPSKSPSTTRPQDIDSASHTKQMTKCHTPDTKSMRVLPSPPVSPWMSKRGKEEREENATERIIKDPLLYPETEYSAASEPSLFPEVCTSKSEDDLITQHMAMHMAQFDKKVNRPTREEYKLALACVPQIGRLYNRNPGVYMKRQREESENQYWQAKRICARPGTKTAPVAIAPAPKQTKRAISRVVTSAKTPLPRAKRPPKVSPIAKLMGYPTKGRSETPDRVPGAKREDVDYNSLPDYAPPTSTLPKGNPKVLKADWPSNNVLNLANDPDRHMLHEAEINLAGTLRLNCATYLCSKRRIFEARLNALRIGKEFRKTDAQQACKIDVNKASKLWSAYDKVDWFNKGYFEQHL